MSEPLAAAPFLVAGWLVDPRANELSSGRATHRLEPKVMEVLVALAERPGEPVTREELLERVWPGVFVSESALSRCVSQLRKLFDDNSREPSVIETLSKVGYRLIAPVRPALSGDSLDADGAAGDGSRPAVADVLLAVAPHHTSRRARRRVRLVAIVIGTVLLAGGPAAVLSGRLDRTPTQAVVTPLTTTRGTETGAAPSPDGSRIAFVGSSEQGGNQDLYVQVIGASSALRLTSHPAADMAPAWSPDGRRIAFLRCDRGGDCDIRVVSALGGDDRRLLAGSSAAGGGLAWSPDGTTLAYSAWEAPRPETREAPVGTRRTTLRLLEVATGRSRRLTTPPPGLRGDGQPRFSPDGRLIAFRRDVGPGFSDLHIVPAGGGSARALTDDRRFLAGHTWTADGRAVIFSSERNGLFQLWRVPAAGGPPELVRSVSTRDPGGPAVGPGGRLVFEEWDFETDVWRVTPDEPPAALVTSTWRDLQPHAAADGRVAFASDRSGAWEIWTARADGSEPVRLTSFGGPAALHPRWSPDGRHIAFELRDTGRASVQVVDAEGGVPRAVTPAGMDAVVPRWTRDGRAIYVSTRRSGRWEAWRVPLTGGEPVQVTRDGGYAAEELPDGRLAYSKYGVPGLFVRSLIGGPEGTLYPGLSPVDAANWWVRGDQVVVPSRQQGAIRLVTVDSRTGATASLPTLIQHLGGGEASLAPLPGPGVVYTRTMRVEADLVAAEPFDGR